ncbi:unnamed protein product [Eruca vesicaria subsp. sativa]|uniref:Uncharacterized protein n=1 Tax=Eruca vesicaria subsp. sativa TaxID=29727 RepID=A0ABC8KP44_ERUVS|nr:unnamed protein product [Eruca vesicaria subsp. sativa]
MIREQKTRAEKLNPGLVMILLSFSASTSIVPRRRRRFGGDAFTLEIGVDVIHVVSPAILPVVQIDVAGVSVESSAMMVDPLS